MDKWELKKVIELEDVSPKGMIKTIFEKADGKYILKAEYKGQIEWIEMNSGTDFYDREKEWEFQVVFPVSEAIKYGFTVPCEFKLTIDPYRNLTCDPSTLEHLEKISEVNYLGAFEKEDIYECPKCKNVWRIIKNYDSHRGYWNNCYLVKGTRGETIS